MSISLSTIIEKLKVLKLHGMKNSVTARYDEATKNQLAPIEFLSLLIEDEILDKEQRRYERRYKKASFRGIKTIENFDFGFNPKINQKQIRDLVTCQFVKEKSPVIIVGPCGTGKTHIAQALGHAALQQGCDVVCTTQSKLSEELKIAQATNTYEKKLKAIAKIDVLIIDDFGLKPLRTPEDENMHDVISERYEYSTTIVTSNLSLDEWQHAFPNQLLGVATVDRIRHNAHIVLLEGKGYRKPRVNKK